MHRLHHGKSARESWGLEQKQNLWRKSSVEKEVLVIRVYSSRVFREKDNFCLLVAGVTLVIGTRVASITKKNEWSL